MTTCSNLEPPRYADDHGSLFSITAWSR